MTPAKMTITPDGMKPIEVMFNPTTYSISKEVAWTPTASAATGAPSTDSSANAPATHFDGGHARRLQFELFYDVTHLPDAASRDVRRETDRIVNLTRIARGKTPEGPPVCTIEWGGQSKDFPFIGTLTSLTQNFVLFGPDGKPWRAKLSITFTEYLDRTKDQKDTDPEMTTRTVRRGDTLAGISAEFYRDPALWRVIAQANRIENPLKIPAGLKLVLPKR